ncbi:MAG: hypothetical protein NC548_27770 [Lachnospiraceae bacterium]|nr:hypothetical protein [Lachnospiraceae bacterium]
MAKIIWDHFEEDDGSVNEADASVKEKTLVEVLDECENLHKCMQEDFRRWGLI